MKEQLVSFDTAKLAKEKGFIIPSHSYYFEDGEFNEFEIRDTYGYYGDDYTVSRSEFYENWNGKWKTTKEGDRCFGCDKNPKYLETFSAPTQTLLQKWLREIHQIEIYVRPSFKVLDKYIVVVMQWRSDRKFRTEHYTVPINENNVPEGTHQDFNLYEEALEAGLQKALKLIK